MNRSTLFNSLLKATGSLWRLAFSSLFLILGLVSANHQSGVWIYGGGTFAAGDNVSLDYYIPDSWNGSLKLYRIMNPEKVLELGGPRDFQGVEELDLRLERNIEITNNRDAYGSSNLGRLRLGLYYAQLETDHAPANDEQSTASATLILVTDLGMVVKSDADTVLTYTAHLPTSEPRKAQVFLLKDDGIYAEGLADDEGLTNFSLDDGSADEVIVAAKFGTAWIFSDAYWSRWAVENAKIYVQTDRPVYRPTHTVFFKGTARSPSGLNPLANEEVQVRITASDGTEILQETYETDDFGSFDGELVLGVEPPLGSYNIQTSVAGETSYASFNVEEFQKPEYRVTVSAVEDVTVQGDKANFTIKAEYLFGGAVAGGQVNYAVLKQPHYRWRYISRYGFYEDYNYNGYYGGEMIERGEGVLNADGELVVEVDLPKDEQDYELTLQAGVTDEARREISSTGTVVAYRSSIVLNVETNRYASKVGEEITVTIKAEDIEGNPVSVPFRLEAERSYWERNVGRLFDNPTTRRGRTDEDGVAILKFSLDTQGSYYLTAIAEDEAERETSAERFLWVSDGSRWYWNYDGLSITADKPEYEMGDTARFVIQSPVTDAYMLVSREGDAIKEYEVIKLDGSVLTYEFTITQDMTPNSYLSAVIIGDGEYYSETIGFRVPPADKFLNIEITSNSDIYKPQETGSFALRVSDVNGDGVHAQVAVGLVDEGIYLVRPESAPDIRGFFYALKSNVVGTQLAAWYYFGQAEPVLADMASGALAPSPVQSEAREAMDEAVFGQSKAEADFAAADVREDFRDTILWLPYVETDNDGFADVEVTFPDNLTEWRLTARAITLADEVGQDTYNVTTTLPVIARLAAPRFFIRGDEASLRVIGQNNLEDSQQGQLELSSEGLFITNPEPQSTTLPAGGRTTGDFGIIAHSTGTSTVTATALTKEASDAMKLPIPVLPHGIREEIGWADSGSSRWTFDLPSNTDLHSTGGTLYLTPSLAAAVSPALSYLAGYPYGCTEQTMSRFLPSVLAAQAGDLANLPEDIEENLDDIVQKGLKRLYDFQHDDGGWGFWKYDTSSLFISSYVVNGFLDAKAADYLVRDWVLESALDYLEQNVRSQDAGYDHRVVAEDAKAYAYFALARAGRNVDGILKQDKRELSPYGLALSALAFSELEQEREANLYLDALMAKISERDRVAFWDTGTPRYYWNDDDIEATAYGLEALVRLRPDEPVIGKVVNWLLLQRQGARWVSTKDTAAVIKSALKLAEVSGEAGFDYQVSVELNSEVLETRRIEGQNTSSFNIDLSNFNAGQNDLSLSVEGEGTLYASAGVHFVAERDYLVTESKHINIKRSYETLIPVFDEEEQRYRYERSGIGRDNEVGDYVLVTVEIDPKDDYRYVLVNEPLPAGYRVIENDQAFRVSGLETRYGYDWYGWNYWYDGRDVRDERVDYYFSYLGNPVTFTYILRAETPGRFTALPTQAWLMYEPEVRGVGTQAELSVIDIEASASVE